RTRLLSPVEAPDVIRLDHSAAQLPIELIAWVADLPCQLVTPSQRALDLRRDVGSAEGQLRSRVADGFLRQPETPSDLVSLLHLGQDFFLEPFLVAGIQGRRLVGG